MNTNKVLIIAEAGVNHNGDINMAKRLVDAALDAKADIVKFQTFKAKNIASAQAPKADYQKKTTGNTESQLEMLEKLELSESDHLVLIDYCQQKGIEFLSTPFDLESIDLLHKLGLNTFKIPSGELNNLPYLKKIASLNKKVILSTGMATLGEVESNLEVLLQNGTVKSNISLLHCHSEYPTPIEKVNLYAMQTMRDAFKINVGYSDHTEGVEVPVAAVALGATIIEKHFTLDKTLKGPDHKASLEPNELKRMVEYIRNIEKALGDGIKKPTDVELKNKTAARKSIHIKVDLKAGDVISENNIVMKRPGNGISPMSMAEVLGRKIIVDAKADTMLDWNHISTK